uniref:Uncharacterized protein n=1 Tax=Anguilla anguilla TaxID=7936 RepID=A0A0E9Q0S8_ANGAN
MYLYYGGHENQTRNSLKYNLH